MNLAALLVVGALAAGATEESDTSRALQISIHVPQGLDKPQPVTGGVPLPKGTVRNGTTLAIRSDAGTALPLQTTVLAKWEDGSTRWLLLDFQAPAQPAGRQTYTLGWDNHASTARPPAPVTHQAEPRPAIRTGATWISTGDHALLNIADRFDFTLVLIDEEGQQCQAVVESVVVENAGDLKAVLAMKGAFRRPHGERIFQFRLRTTVYAGCSTIRLEPMILIDADKGVMQRVRALTASLRPRTVIQSYTIGGTPSWTGQAEAAVRLLQIDDQQYRFDGAPGQGKQAPGWIEMTDGWGTASLALRDFWQQWPKSIEVSRDQVAIGLLPAFRKGDFDHMQPWYKYQYLFEEDTYRIRTGQARRWDLRLDLAGKGDPLARVTNAPPVLAADPAQAIATGVWGPMAPAGIPAMAEYDPWAEQIFEAYCRSIEAQRDYGAMNWGDWFGERKVNWGNHEYDTVQQIQLQFARTGDPRYFCVADAAARHSSEVDTIHFLNPDLVKVLGTARGYPPRPGMVHQHTVGHVSGFYSTDRVRELFVENGIGGSKNPYLCLDPYNLGHIWTQGTARQYLLTGDPFFKETVQRIADNLVQLVKDREYQFMGHSHCGRTTGWPLLALSGAYELDLDNRYLEAMKILVDNALAEQDPVCGGWLYSLPQGHCNCKKAKHVGMAGFITAVLINGLSQYYDYTGDPRVAAAIRRGVTFLDNDTWQEQWHDWRYTSCPATGATSQPGVVIMAHVNAVHIANQPEHRRILEAAWNAKFHRLLGKPPQAGPGQGKTFSSTMYGCPQAIGLLSGQVVRHPRPAEPNAPASRSSDAQ